MSVELEAQLRAVPERWRDATRTRAYAVMDYVAAGADGALLVDVLCRRTDLTRSAFYGLVRRWKASGGDAAALAPWARRSNSKPRVAFEVTAHIDMQVEPLIAADPNRSTEPIALKVLDDWPAGLSKPGISYVRRRIGHVRSEQQKKTRLKPQVLSDEDDQYPRPVPRWPLDVIVVDHVAVEAIVWSGEQATLPIATVAIDLASGRPVGVSIGLAEPGPAAVMAAIGCLAIDAAGAQAPGPPTIVLATAFANGWPDLIALLERAGAEVVAIRSRSLRFGHDANDLLNGRFDGYKLAPRLGHRPIEARVTPRSVLSLPSKDLDGLAKQMNGHARAEFDALTLGYTWPHAATTDPTTWGRLAALAGNASI